MTSDVRRRLEEAFREEHGLLLAAILRKARGFEVAEDALQEACSRALQAWPSTGVPKAPGAWLYRVALRCLIDCERRRRCDESALGEIAAEISEAEIGEAGGLEHAVGDESIPDERLRLVFTCCHPALAEEVRVALTLHALCGFTAADLGRAFLVREATMAQRLVRAKRRIRGTGIPYRVPRKADLPERLSAVLAVIYLIYNEGYAADPSAPLERRELATEARRLVTLLDRLLPGRAEVEGLGALLLVLEARRASRYDAEGRFVALAEQDRSTWDEDLMAAGMARLERAISRDDVGPYALQAAIAAEHVRARHVDETDWRQIVRLYDALLATTASPVVALNRACAVAEVDGPEAGLAAIRDADLAAPLANYAYLHATVADLSERARRPAEEVRSAWERALRCSATDAERAFFSAKLDAGCRRDSTPPRGTSRPQDS